MQAISPSRKQLAACVTRQITAVRLKLWWIIRMREDTHVLKPRRACISGCPWLAPYSRNKDDVSNVCWAAAINWSSRFAFSTCACSVCCSLLPTLYTVGCQLNRSTLSLTNVNGMRSHGNLGLQSKREYNSQESPALHKLEGLTKSIFQLDHFEKENSSMIAMCTVLCKRRMQVPYIFGGENFLFCSFGFLPENHSSGASGTR